MYLRIRHSILLRSCSRPEGAFLSVKVPPLDPAVCRMHQGEKVHLYHFVPATMSVIFFTHSNAKESTCQWLHTNCYSLYRLASINIPNQGKKFFAQLLIHKFINKCLSCAPIMENSMAVLQKN